MRPVRAALLLACSWAHADEIDWAGLELEIETSVLYSPPGSTIQRDTEALISIFNNTAQLQVARAFTVMRRAVVSPTVRADRRRRCMIQRIRIAAPSPSSPHGATSEVGTRSWPRTAASRCSARRCS